MSIQRKSINKNIPVPLYYQFKQIVLDSIHSGDLKPGDMLPSEFELMDMYELSRTPIRQAMKELEIEGYIYRVKSKGTFVAQPRIPQMILGKLGSFRREMAEQGFVPSIKVIKNGVEPAPKEVSEALVIPENEQVYLHHAVRYADDMPILVEKLYVHPVTEAFLNNNIADYAFYEVTSMDKRTAVVRSERTIESVLATEDMHKFLHVPTGFPIQRITAVDYNAQGFPCVYVSLSYRGDKNKFKVVLHAENTFSG